MGGRERDERLIVGEDVRTGYMIDSKNRITSLLMNDQSRHPRNQQSGIILQRTALPSTTLLFLLQIDIHTRG